MSKLVFVGWLWTLVGACGAASSSQVQGDAAPPAPACEAPEQAGCAECCVVQWGPAGEQMCNRRVAAERRESHADGRDYAEQSELRNTGPCPRSCRPCAACTRDRKKSYQRLLARGCDCLDPFVRDVVRGLDPCFTEGCGCTCSLLAELSECGPPR